MKEHSREFGIYHWDTFDNTTLLVGEADTLKEAIEIVAERYEGQIRPNGADRVEIVDGEGKVVRKFAVV